MKTIKQMADELGVDKQKVYRFIKREALHEALHENGVMWFDEAVETRIKSEFSKSEAHHDAVDEALHDVADKALLMRCEALEKRVEELEGLNQWLRDQVDQMSAQNSVLVQSLAAATVAKKQQLVLPDPSKRRWWQFWR